MFLGWLFLHWSCGQERLCAFLKRDNESVPNHGVSSRDEGVQEQGPEVVSVENAHTVVGDSIISFSSVLSPEHHPQAWVCLRLQSGLMPQKRKRGEGRK